MLRLFMEGSGKEVYNQANADSPVKEFSQIMYSSRVSWTGVTYYIRNSRNINGYACKNKRFFASLT